jgi:hypothetical protein
MLIGTVIARGAVPIEWNYIGLGITLIGVGGLVALVAIAKRREGRAESEGHDS